MLLEFLIRAKVELAIKVGEVGLRASGDLDDALGQHADGALELGHVLSVLLGHHGVALQHLVLEALFNGEFGAGLILETTDGEGHGGILLHNFVNRIRPFPVLFFKPNPYSD